MEDITSRYGG